MGLRVHVMGAAGAGVTTLGLALAQSLAAPHHDTDDYYWKPTPEPFTETRPEDERLALMREMFVDAPAWVLSGSVAGWGDPLMPVFDAVVFVRTPQAIRIERLRRRETLRHGAAALREGGPRYVAMEAFLACAARYEEAGYGGRSLTQHRAWLARLACPVIESDGARPLSQQVERVLAALPISCAAESRAEPLPLGA